MTAPLPNYAMSTADAVEALTVLIERSGIDITANYGDWCNIGFALAQEFGAAGEAFFHRISAFYPNYDPKTASKQYLACLRHEVPTGKVPVTIATLFHIAKSHGISLPIPPLRGGGRRPGEFFHTLKEDFSARKPIAESAESAENSAEPLPTFSQSISDNLPTIMQRIVKSSVSDVDADILVLGSLTVMSACIPKVYGMYDGREVFANLFLFVTARASAGKGRLSLCRHLAEPIHQALRDKYDELKTQYEAALAAYAVNRKNTLETPPKEPPFLTLFLPANSTSTVVYQVLAQNSGVGLLFETEGDTLANAFKSDLGNYSDGFRKAFHHEMISYLRKKDLEYVELGKPKFSAVLSGTPQQILNLIPDAENGLFSRFIFYVMPTQLVWHDMFVTKDNTTADEKFERIGRDFCTLLKKLPDGPIQFTLSSAQGVQFNDFFRDTQSRYAAIFGEEIVATVRRLGLIMFRIAMILTVLRHIEEVPAKRKKSLKKMVCTDVDYDTALAVIQVLLQHSAAVFQTLPRRTDHAAALKGRRQLSDAVRQKFLAALPDTFDRPTYIQVAASLNIIERTAERYVSDLCKSGHLTHPANGQYTKPPS
ncbi:MAG: primase 2 [bacterium F083]|nr:MAG: primase 2 [bacterium F083]